MAKKSFVDWLYTTAPGRVTLKVLLQKVQIPEAYALT